ncbi:MAG: transposase [Gammaproteobacteria bacterium]|nr:transposase [Gammaproteobacteria bacterium]NNJ84736.1 hypothetical protein [Gammaproteobacteria bacterium]
MENHLHLVAAAPDLSATMQRFKSWTARRIIDYLEKSRSRRMELPGKGSQVGTWEPAEAESGVVDKGIQDERRI